MGWILIIGAVLSLLYGLVYPFRAFIAMRDNPDMIGFEKKFWGVIGILFMTAFWLVMAIILFGLGAQQLST